MIAAEGEQKASRALREASEVIVSNGDVLVVGGGNGGVVGLLLLRPAR